MSNKKPCIWYNVCPIKTYADNNMIPTKWVKEYCLKANKNCIRYQLENKGQFHPDNMMPDGSIDATLPI